MINYDLAGHLEDLLTRPGLMYPFEYIARAVSEYNRLSEWNPVQYAYMSWEKGTLKIDIILWKTIYFLDIPGTGYYIPVDGPAEGSDIKEIVNEEAEKICKALKIAI